MKRATRPRRGMTLIEVILAIAILGVSMAFLLTAASRCLAIVRLARLYQEAAWTLSLGDAEHPYLVEEEADELDVDGETYPNGHVYSRTVEDDDDEDGLYVVRTRVSWSSFAGESDIEVVRYVYHPADDE